MKLKRVISKDLLCCSECGAEMYKGERAYATEDAEDGSREIYCDDCHELVTGTISEEDAAEIAEIGVITDD